jgi:hypothetical protein
MTQGCTSSDALAINRNPSKIGRMTTHCTKVSPTSTANDRIEEWFSWLVVRYPYL